MITASCTMEVTAQSYNLDSCVVYARNHSIDRRQSQAQYTLSKANYREAIGKLLPQLEANTNIYFNFGRGLNAETNTYIDVNSFSNNYNLSGSLLIFDGLRSLYEVKRMRYEKESARIGVREAQDLAELATMEAYYNLLYSKGMVTLAGEQLHESGELLTQVTKMEEVGIKSHPDVLEISAREASDKMKLSQAETQLKIAEIQLKERMNYPIDSALVIEDVKPLDDKDINLPDTHNTLAFALKNNPKMLRAQLDERMAQSRARGSWGNLMPVLRMGAGIQTNFSRLMDGGKYEPFRNQLKNKQGSYVGFSLSIPLFTGFTASGNVVRARAQHVITELEAQRTRQKLYSDIAQTIGDLEGAMLSYLQGVKQTEATKAAYDASNARYKAGLVTAIELSATANRYTEARINLLKAQTLYLLKQRWVAYYNGQSAQ